MIHYRTIRKCSGTSYEMEVRAINFHLLLILAKRTTHVLNYKIFHAQYDICLRQIYYQPKVFLALSCLPNASNNFPSGSFFKCKFLVQMSNTKINNDVQFVLICSVLFSTLLLSVFHLRDMNDISFIFIFLSNPETMVTFKSMNPFY